MLHNNTKKSLIDNLIEIVEKINKQIPLAANLHEEFESPPVTEDDHDIDIQFQMHEELLTHLHIHYLANHEIKKLYNEYITENDIEVNCRLTQEQNQKLEVFMHTKIKSIYYSIEKYLALVDQHKTFDFDSIKEQVIAIINQKLPLISQQGLMSLDFDEKQFIEVHFQALRNKILRIVNKIVANCALEDDELKLFNIYRRENLPHEELITQLFHEVSMIKYLKAKSISIQPEIIEIYKQDALHNINRLAEKIAARNHTYAQRFDLTQNLIEIRETYSSNFSKTILDKVIASVADDFLCKTERKSIELANKSYIYQYGLLLWKQSFNTGFCGEHKAMAIAEILKRNIHTEQRVEEVSISYGDEDGHTFVVINRDLVSTLNDMTTWGSKAIILDAWLRLVCYVQDIDKQGKKYRSYPTFAKWEAIEYSDRDRILFDQANLVNENFTITNNTDPDIREGHLIEEFELRDIPDDSSLLDYLREVVTRYQPNNFKYEIKFYITTMNDELIKYIPGFRNPVIAFHPTVLSHLIDGKLSLTAFEYELVVLLYKLKMMTNYVSPLSISHQSQQRLDMLAMEKINSTESSIAYLRLAAEFKQTQTKTIATLGTIERTVAGLRLKYITHFEHIERIKILQASVAAGVAKEYKGEIAWPSPRFKGNLANLIGRNLHENKLLISTALSIPQPIILDKIEDKCNKPKNKKKKKKRKNKKRTTHVITHRIHIPTASELRIQKLKKLKEYLIELKIEVIAYELYQLPSIRMRQFLEAARDINVDFDNPAESDLVDDIINEAHALRIPCFDYIYLGFCNPLGLETPDFPGFYIYSDTKETYPENRFILVRDSKTNVDSLFYISEKNERHDIPIEKIHGLKNELENSTPDKLPESIYEHVKYRLTRLFGMRPLGFFKQMQGLITRFIASDNYQQALELAQDIENFRLKYLAHFEDGSYHSRYYKHKKKLSEAGHSLDYNNRYYGTEIARLITWRGFDAIDNTSNESVSYEKFLNWAKKDSSGLMACILFRLGLSNHADIIQSLTPDQLNEFSEHYSYTCINFWGDLTGPHQKFMRLHKFSSLSQWLMECNAKAHSLEDTMFANNAISFEERFILYFDKNFPALRQPNLNFNSNNAATIRLLNEFYSIATTGEQSEIEVVKSFFYGREDKRDLKNLLLHNDSQNSINLDSFYTLFILLQKYEDKTHNIFDNYDLIKLLVLDYISFSSDSDKLTLKDYQIIFRLPNQDNINELFNIIMDLLLNQFKEYDYLRYDIIECYLKEIGQLVVFSKCTCKLLEFNQGYIYIASALRKALCNGTWPDLQVENLTDFSIDNLILYYALFDYNTIFPTRQFKHDFGDLIFKRIEALTDLKKRIDYMERMLYSKAFNLPLTDINLKNKLVETLANYYAQQFGPDDGSTEYEKRVMPIIINLYEKLSNRDIRYFMSCLLTKIEAQRKISETVGMYVDPADFKLFTSKRFKASRAGLVSLIKIADFFGKEVENQQALLNYLSDSLKKEGIDGFIEHIKQKVNIRELSRKMGWSAYDYNEEAKIDVTRADEKLGTIVTALYYQFWDCSLHERAAIIEQLIIPASKTLSLELQTVAYEKGLEYISHKLFPKFNDHQSEDYLALCILKSYLNAADNFIRAYLLTAILVSANDNSGVDATMGKKLAIVCEHMGPAYVKLAQAIHSHPSTPPELRADLAHVKGRANPPHRWSLWRQIGQVLTPEALTNIKRLGRLLGSASYNLALEVTLQNNDNVVLLLLRENAEESSRKGFEHLRATINNCIHESIQNQRVTIVQTIDEAARLSRNEMVKEASDQQAELAAQLYPTELMLTVENKNVQFSIQTAKVSHSGTGYRFIDLMHGIEFNSLADETAEQRFVKHAVAKAVLTMELHNLVRGGQFDSDRHGSQLRVVVNNPLDIHLGLYDFGEMTLEKPDELELTQLADIIGNLFIDQYMQKSIDDSISERLNLAIQLNESTHFLMRIRKSFLALHDFKPYLTQQDFLDVLKIVRDKDDLHPILYWPLQRLHFTSYVVTTAYNKALSLVGFFRSSDEMQSTSSENSNHLKK